MKTCAIFNRRSSSADRIEARLAKLADDSGVALIGVESQTEAEFQKLILSRKYERLIVAGGDGTISRLVNMMGEHRRQCQWAILPAGTGNDLARSLGVPLDDIEAAWQLAIGGESRSMDVVQVTNGAAGALFVNAATGGFGGTVAVDIEPAEKRRWGAFAYWLAGVSKLADLQEYQIELELDDRTERLTIYGLGVANGRYVGGGFPIAPRALVDDGLLNVTAVPVLPAMDLVSAGFHFAMFNEEDQRVKSFQSSRVHIHTDPQLPFSIDGEPTRTIDATFEVLPAAIHVVAGPAPEAVAVRDFHRGEPAS